MNILNPCKCCKAIPKLKESAFRSPLKMNEPLYYVACCNKDCMESPKPITKYGSKERVVEEWNNNYGL